VSEAPPPVTEGLLGTPEHPHARDISQFLVHITSDEDSLGSIHASGILDAREPHGFTKGLHMVRESHLSACPTEMPLSELSRMRRFGKYGIAFRREFAIRSGGQRVWYLNDGCAPGTAAGLVDTRGEWFSGR